MNERPQRILPRRWTKIASWATFAWVLFIWMEIQGDFEHPMAKFMFLVPLGAWVAMIAVAKVFGVEVEAEDKPKKKPRA